MLSRERLHAHNQSFERASQPRWYAAEVATDPTAVIRRKEKREREKKKETRKRRKNKMKKKERSNRLQYPSSFEQQHLKDHHT